MEELIDDSASPFFITRGVVLLTRDIATGGWVEKVKAAGLSTIATHVTPTDVISFIKTEQGEAFLDVCKTSRTEVEHELHAIGQLLPRKLFYKDPSMFRMNEQGERIADWNLCVHSPHALDVVCENALAIAQVLRPTTGRYFFWIDDGKPMCRCPRCNGLSDSDQALILENRVLQALRELDPQATVAHLAYSNTFKSPTQIKPKPGIFLEFAPIHRSYQVPLSCREKYASDPKRANHQELLDALEANLKVFGRDNAQILEYWLDVSLFSGWERGKIVKLPWNYDVFLEDLQTYSKFGIRHVTSFACWIDGDYITRFGEPPVKEYGSGLLNFKPDSVQPSASAYGMKHAAAEP